MEKFKSILLEVWQLTSKHLEISESISMIADLIKQNLRFDQIIIFQHNDQKQNLLWIAQAYPEPCSDFPQTIELNNNDNNTLQKVFQTNETCNLSSLENKFASIRCFHSMRQNYTLFFGALYFHNEAGLLLILRDKKIPFNQHEMMLFNTLLEPFSVALENHSRLHELERLRRAVEAENTSLLAKLGRQNIEIPIVGESSGLSGVMKRVDLVAKADAPVLILGETGSGKEVIARAIHDRSHRKDNAFLRVNCGAIPHELIDSQLFGHEKGAFTGAIHSHEGWFARAHEGTLFLDEIGELPLAAQVRLLRILQDGYFERVGGSEQIHVDVRIIAATNQNLVSMIPEGKFREDLWYRIAVFPIVLPPLRQRKEDIEALAIHFAERASIRFGVKLTFPSPEQIQLLSDYDWPGNIRELAAVIDRAVILGNGESLDIEASLGLNEDKLNFKHSNRNESTQTIQKIDEKKLYLDIHIKEHIQHILKITKGRIEGPYGAAKVLNVNPHTLRAKMKKLNIDWKLYKNDN